MFQKKNLAKVLGYGQLLAEYINMVLQQNGGVLPTTKAGWFHLIGSIVLAGGIHIASETSAGHPNGLNTK